jgi:hypothetical protein
MTYPMISFGWKRALELVCREAHLRACHVNCQIPRACHVKQPQIRLIP